MNHKRSVIVVPALAAVVFTLTAAEATARVIPEHTTESRSVMPHDPPAVPYVDETITVTADDAAAEGVQAGAAALGGAGLALVGMWRYRRRLGLTD
jgi:hypothetical protein